MVEGKVMAIEVNERDEKQTSEARIEKGKRKTVPE